MIVRVRIGDRELDRYAVEKRRLGEFHAARAKVRRDLEFQPIAADLEGLAFEQRRRRATVGVQDGLRESLHVIPGEPMERHSNPGSGTAVGRVENVSRELADDGRLGAWDESLVTAQKCIDFRAMRALPTSYPRDLRGYGRDVPHARWPGAARVAVQFVLNYEEGGESNVLHGDAASEIFLSEIVGAQAFEARHLSMESMYEYGSRAGVWRILREFESVGWPLTVFGVGMALQRHPELVAHFVERGDEIANHGLRWIHYQDVPESHERAHLVEATRVIREMTDGQWPLGWYTGRDSPNTRRLVVDEGSYEYDSDYYGDDLPLWMQVEKSDGTRVPHLVVPYTLDANDMRFATPQGFNTAEHFFTYLRDSFDALFGEGDPDGLDRPKMMSIGMHCRLLGKPGRILALRRFIDHVAAHEQVWVCRRIDIARHWKTTHPFEMTAEEA